MVSNKQRRKLISNDKEPEIDLKSRDPLEEDSADKDLTEVMANASQADEEDNFDGLDQIIDSDEDQNDPI